MKLVTSSFFENLKMALNTLRGNKLRSFLTIFGVVVGVITVMLISSIISGFNVAIEKQVESFGTRSIFLYKYNIGFSTGRRSQEERMRKPLRHLRAFREPHRVQQHPHGAGLHGHEPVRRDRRVSCY